MQLHLVGSSHTLTSSSLPQSSLFYVHRTQAAAAKHHRNTAFTAPLRLCRNPNLTSQGIRLATFTCYSDDGDTQSNHDDDDVSYTEDGDDAGGGNVEIEIEKLGKRLRRIRSKVAVNANLQNVWDVLTDYERLADFIPALAVSQLLHKEPNKARLLQVGEQDLAFGLKFNAKCIVDCYEKDMEDLPIGQRRDIEFKMVEGDFKIFEGKWSIEQCNTGRVKEHDSVGQAFHTTLIYIVEVEPKPWLPVRVVEGVLCKEIKNNLRCVREEAQRVYLSSSSN